MMQAHRQTCWKIFLGGLILIHSGADGQLTSSPTPSDTRLASDEGTPSPPSPAPTVISTMTPSQATLLNGVLTAPTQSLEDDGAGDAIEVGIQNVLGMGDSSSISVIVEGTTTRRKLQTFASYLRGLRKEGHRLLQDTNGTALFSVSYFDNEEETGQEQATEGLAILQEDESEEIIAGSIGLTSSEVELSNLVIVPPSSSTNSSETSSSGSGSTTWVIAIIIIAVAAVAAVCVCVSLGWCYRKKKNAKNAAAALATKSPNESRESEGNTAGGEVETGNVLPERRTTPIRPAAAGGNVIKESGYTEGGDGTYSEFGPDRYSEYEPSVMEDNAEGMYSQEGSRFYYDDGASSEWGTDGGTEVGSFTGYRRASSKFLPGPRSQASFTGTSSTVAAVRTVPSTGSNIVSNTAKGDSNVSQVNPETTNFSGDSAALTSVNSRGSLDSAAGSVLVPSVVPGSSTSVTAVHQRKKPPAYHSLSNTGAGAMDDDAASAYAQSSVGSRPHPLSVPGTSVGMPPPKISIVDDVSVTGAGCEEVRSPGNESSMADGVSQIGSYAFTDTSPRTERVIDHFGRSGGLNSPTSTVLRSVTGMSEMESERGSRLGSPYSERYSNGSDSPGAASGWERAWMRQRSDNRRYGGD